MTAINKEILIVGQGYAGSLIAWMLIQKNFNVTVIDSEPEFTSSKVAAGIMLPVTGRRLAKTHLADLILPFAHNLYKKMEAATGVKFFMEKKVLQLFISVSNRNEWYSRSGEKGMQDYCDMILTQEQVDKSINNDFGGILLKQSGFVDSVTFLKAIKNYITENGIFLKQQFNYNDLQVNKKNLLYRGKEYEKIIFCEGYHSVKNPFFSYIPFKPAKGEILDFLSEELSDDYIITDSVYILPLGNNKFRTGSTYNWDDLTEAPTPQGLKILTENLEKTINCKYIITDHKAGIRPAIRDRRPVIGFHPLHENIGIFNGLGTKGAMLGPYYAKQIADLITDFQQPDADVNVRRFDSLVPVP